MEDKPYRAGGWCALALLVIQALPAQGQHRLFGRPPADPCPPYCPPLTAPVPTDPSKKPAPTDPSKKPETPPKTEPTPPTAPTTPPLSFEGGPAVRGESFAYATPNLQGDQLGIPAIAFGQRGNPRFPRSPGEVAGAVVVPSVRSFKIADNDSPFLRDRVYFGYNYYQEVNKAVNRAFGSDLENLRAHRATFGLEKTCLDGDFSVGFRLPVNTLNADSLVPGVGGDSTAVGDLSIIFKAALWGDREAGRVVTTGLAITTPTGPDRFASFDNISPQVHTTVLQPFVGAAYTMGDFYVHGFTALDVPTSSRDVTMWYTDVGLGWFLHRDRTGDSCVTAIVPTLELHVNTPLSHRGILRNADLVGTPDVIALTSGVTFEFHRRATLALGFVTPLSGPRPFDWEVLAQFGVRFGPGTSGQGGLLGF